MTHIIVVMDEIYEAGSEGTAASSIGRAKKRSAEAAPLSSASASQTWVSSHSTPQEPPVRMDRVNALRQAIADGTYHVSAADLADKILKRMQA